jgi:hypothetical protein
MQWPEERVPKLKIFVTDLILDSYKNIPVAYVTCNA